MIQQKNKRRWKTMGETFYSLKLALRSGGLLTRTDFSWQTTPALKFLCFNHSLTCTFVIILSTPGQLYIFRFA